MTRLDKCTKPFDKHQSRHEAGGIYRKDWAATKNPYDSERVEQGIKATKAGTGKSNLVDLKRQQKRDYSKVVKASVGEAYANIQRENEKADYMKKLLMQAQ